MITRPPIIIPPALQTLAAEWHWLGWRWVAGKDGKFTKPPFRADAPSKYASSSDPSTWCNLEIAMQAYREERCDGIGFVLTGTDVAAFDIDDCRDANTGTIHPWAKDLVRRSGSYAEVTPSGEGIRIIGRGSGEPVHRKFSVPKADGISCELYRKAIRYITITGNQIGTATEMADIDALLDETLADFNGEQPRTTNGAGQGRQHEHDLESLIKNGCGNDFGGDRSRAVWYVINQLLKQGRTADEIVAVLLDRSNGISAHIYDQSQPEQYAKRQVEKAQRVQILPPPSAPVLVARSFVKDCCLHNGAPDALTVRYWCGSWWTWRTTHWSEAEPHTMKSMLYKFTADAKYVDSEGETKPWSPTRNKISDLLEALMSLVILSDEFEQPSWTDGRKTGPIVATANGLLDVASLQLHRHTPFYFGQVSVPFPYDPGAPEPTKFLDFLDELWPDEPDAVDVLGEWYGCVISGRLDLQKIFVMIGPTRGGKGVIARILTALIGKRNVCGPTLSSFGSHFGLMPLLGKSLAIISDARSGSGRNSVSSVAVERLLSISGEDTLTVDRKYKEPYTGKLPVRLHIISNELPRFGDASGAIIGRLVLLTTTRSWLGKEDIELETKLRTELSGILNWSLEGLRRLAIDNENHFTRFAAADEAIIQMQDLASPVRAFVRECCVLDAQAEIEVDALWAAYKTWREASEHPKMDKAHFGRDLHAAFHSVRKRRPRDKDRQKDKEKRSPIYAGIRLRSDEEEAPL